MYTPRISAMFDEKKRNKIRGAVIQIFILTILASVLITLGMALFYTREEFFSEKFDNIIFKHIYPAIIGIDEEDAWHLKYINACAEGNLSARTECIVDNAAFDYKYVRHNDSRVRSPEQTIKEGGVCRDWTNLYSELFKKAGIKTKEVHIEGADVSHIFLISYDEGCNYCLIDGKEAYCP